MSEYAERLLGVRKRLKKVLQVRIKLLRPVAMSVFISFAALVVVLFFFGQTSVIFAVFFFCPVMNWGICNSKMTSRQELTNSV